MRTASKNSRSMKMTLVMRTLFACLLVTLLSLAAFPTGAVDAEADAKKALAEWKAAVAAVGAAKKAAKDAQEKKGIALTNFKSGGITAAEQKILDNWAAEEAKANAALEAAMERLFAAREAPENALNGLPDSDLKKELRRQRDGLILDDPNARGESRKGKNPSQLAPQTGETKTSGGLHVSTFNTANGRVILRLPDDMRAGDTISGTVITEPKGQTPEEREKNQSVLGGLALEIDGKRVQPFSGNPEKEREAGIQQTFWIFTTTLSGSGNTVPIALEDRDGQTLAQTNVLIGQMFDEIRKAGEGMTPSGAVITPDPRITQPTHPSGAAITPDPKISNPPFTFPPVGQTGRPIVVTGPFDGNAANTGLRVGNWEDRDSMGRFDLIAESPRKAVFIAPSNIIGATTLNLTEGNTRTTGNYRNVAVNLSAPKTNLLKGERTTLTVEVNGLQGITKPMPLQLDATGVITMAEGNFQNLRITPPEVNQAGRYTTNRAITGQQAGGFTVVATVIVDRFDVCITDDSNRHSGILWNTFTGDYIFTNPGPPPRTGGQPPSGITVTPGGQPPSGVTVTPGGTPPPLPGGTNLTGTGTLARKGCIIVLTHNAPDRRVFARLDACTKAGDATVETTTPQTRVTITDKNVIDNACGSE